MPLPIEPWTLAGGGAPITIRLGYLVRSDWRSLELGSSWASKRPLSMGRLGTLALNIIVTFYVKVCLRVEVTKEQVSSQQCILQRLK